MTVLVFRLEGIQLGYGLTVKSVGTFAFKLADEPFRVRSWFFLGAKSDGSSGGDENEEGCIVEV